MNIYSHNNQITTKTSPCLLICPLSLTLSLTLTLFFFLPFTTSQKSCLHVLLQILIFNLRLNLLLSGSFCPYYSHGFLTKSPTTYLLSNQTDLSLIIWHFSAAFARINSSLKPSPEFSLLIKGTFYLIDHNLSVLFVGAFISIQTQHWNNPQDLA